MRTRTALAAGLGLALTLSACTTSEEPTPTSAPTAQDDATATDDGLEGSVTSNGWVCDYVSPAAADRAAGGEAVTPRGLVTQDDNEAWICEVLSGGPGEQEPIVRLSVRIGEEAREQARERAESQDEIEPGPEYLGRSFISPGLVTGLSSCTRPGASDRSDQAPYTFVAESLEVTDEEVTDDLRAALALAAQGLDKGMGCSPRQAAKDQAESTQAP